jgi:hypothetical protein
MSGPVLWDVVYLMAGAIVFIGGGFFWIAWAVRDMKAGLDEKIMKTAEIITDKIADSRHFMRNEFQAELAGLDEDMERGFARVDANVASVGAKLDMHRSEDAMSFRQLGERLAKVER